MTKTESYRYGSLLKKRTLAYQNKRNALYQSYCLQQNGSRQGGKAGRLGLGLIKSLNIKESPSRRRVHRGLITKGRRLSGRGA